MQAKSLSTRSQEAYEAAKEKGFYDRRPTWRQLLASEKFLITMRSAAKEFERARKEQDNNDATESDSPEHVATIKLALLASEIVEAFDAIEQRGVQAYFEGDKPDGFPFEIADIQIRLFDMCGALSQYEEGFDLEAVVNNKAAYNKTRPTRNGGKSFLRPCRPRTRGS